MLRVQWGLVARAAALGAASGVVCAVGELWADANVAPQPEGDTAGLVRYWAVLGTVIGLASLVEVLLLYVDSLRSVHSIARTAGVPLVFSADDADEVQSPMAAALVRAALELPNPPPQGYAIDPLREVTRWRAVAAGLLYKAKIGLTSFVLKLVLRRVLGRALVRAWLVFAGVPVTAFWNGLVAWVVIREARLRAIGPSAARRFCDLLALEGQCSPERAALVWRAVAATVVRTHDLHPNVAAFMDALREDIGPPPESELDDTGRFLRDLAAAPSADQRQALRALAVAAVLDGKVSGDERRLVEEAAAAANATLRRRDLRRLRAAFVAGRSLDEPLRGLGG